MRTYKVLNYHKHLDKKYQPLKFYIEFADIEETTKFLWFNKVRTFKIYKNSTFWKYMDSGKFVDADLDSFMDSYEVLFEYT